MTTPISKEDRAVINAMMVKGQLNVARCTERLLMDGETVLTVRICGTGAHIDILPPARTSALWRDCCSFRTTQADITYIIARFGCQIRWTITHAEAALMRIADSAREVH